MRKLFLIILTAVAISTPAFATNNKNSWYIKLDVGGSWLQALNLREVYNQEIKLKSKFTPLAIIGFGYYIMDIVRTDITFEAIFSPKFEANFIVEDKYKAQVVNIIEILNALMLNAYIDIFNIDVAGFFIGGGAGISQKKQIVKVNVTNQNDPAVSRSEVRKLKNDFAYQLTTGVSTQVSESITIELAYSWRDYGKLKTPKAAETTGQSIRGHNVILGMRFSF